MTPRFRLTKPAVKDIENISDYLAERAGLAQAEKFLDKLNNKFFKIAQFPKLGRQRNEILPKLRSLFVDSYLILYLPTEQGGRRSASSERLPRFDCSIR